MNFNENSAGHPPVDEARDSQVRRDFQRRKRRPLTPLPKEDIKVILRPRKSLTVKNLFGLELTMAAIEACQNSFGGESFLQRVHTESNIIILSTPHEQVASRLREIKQLKIRGPLQCEPSNDARAPSAASLDNKNDDDAGLALTWTGDGWHTVLSRRRKKNHKQSQKEPEKGLEKKNEKSAGHPLADAARHSQVKRDFQHRKRRGPIPLPKEDIKVILRPHKGLTVKTLFGSELSMVVIKTCWNSFGGESFLRRVHPGSNIIILSTPHEQLAGRLREINQVKIRGRIHPFNAYVADPEDVLRGIIQGLRHGTTQADLMANLRIRSQGVKIERARMPGSSKSAIITFTGDVLPSIGREIQLSRQHLAATGQSGGVWIAACLAC
ncbi:hypothetical protein HPB51_017557 [Rhipicephalus microplus]|uniref:Uncharacterized protein n=1 Tax=Rhipicephalus microplus TaxID=6941 RepID=A0A9J6F574_RHIMP|nr:hypothetical protein HPB51_017557 [Rhipicephalus microplus]